MAQNIKFRTRLGLIAATVGSAVGLGNIWRFPSEVQQNGGAAFLLLYIGCVLILGIPVMLSEFAIGRGGNSDSITSYSNLSPHSKWYLNGWLAVVASYLIAGYYMVVAGWTLEYLWSSITGELYTNELMTGAQYVDHMESFITSSWRPVMWTWIMLGLNIVVLVRGVNKGIERISNVLMPLLFVMLVAFACVSLSLPNAQRGVEFFFKPDFSKITQSNIISALGQAFFSLSLGMGILITYSSYYPAKTNLTRTSVIVSILGFIVALLMGVIIFPAATAFGLTENPEALRGTTLVFVTLPEIFANIPLTRFWSALFFLLLGVAAFTSTISLCEVHTKLIQSKFQLSRNKSCMTVMAPLFVLSACCSMSLGPWSEYTIFGKTLFDFLDNITTNYMLPTCAFFGCIFVGWKMPKTFLHSELSNYGSLRNPFITPITVAVRYIAPALIVIILLSQLM
ncbi:MAG: sodium-dependent transporter [Muribaculaceae bacterium]|nr:sodium-dependent transporter [Muribaculaceae bacterium]